MLKINDGGGRQVNYKEIEEGKTMECMTFQDIPGYFQLIFQDNYNKNQGHSRKI